MTGHGLRGGRPLSSVRPGAKPRCQSAQVAAGARRSAPLCDRNTCNCRSVPRGARVVVTQRLDHPPRDGQHSRSRTETAAMGNFAKRGFKVNASTRCTGRVAARNKPHRVDGSPQTNCQHFNDERWAAAEARARYCRPPFTRQQRARSANFCLRPKEDNRPSGGPRPPKPALHSSSRPGAPHAGRSQERCSAGDLLLRDGESAGRRRERAI
jgi:hypothetical protein